MGWTEAIENALHTWIVSGSGLASSCVIWAGQGGPRPTPPYITLALSSLAPIGRDWLDVEDNPLVFDDDTVEAVDTGADTLTLTGHGLLTGDGPVRLSTTGTLPTGLALATDYWVIKVDADTISLASTFLLSLVPTAIDITGAGSGTHTLSDTSETERIGEEISHLARGQRLGVLNLQCYAATATGTAKAAAILDNALTARTLPTLAAALQAAGVGVGVLEPVTPMSGVIGSTQWEPRAVASVQFFLANELEELTNYIATIELSRI